jgi:hypothetical protein
LSATTEIVLTRPELHAAQQQVVDEARRFNVLQCGRRFGKTTLGVELLLDPALDGKPAAWFAPTYKLLAEPWREIVRATKDVTERLSQQDKRVELITGGSIDCWSLDTPDAGRGYRYARAVIDEAGIVRDLGEAWEQAIRPTLTDYQGDAWFLGTPKGRNYFHRLFTKGQEPDGLWKSWRFRSIDNPHLSATEIDAARHDLPEQVFKQEYLGEPSDDGGNPFGLAAIRACVGPLSGAPAVVWGIDLAKSVDYTVAIGLDASHNVCRLERWQRPWTETIRDLANLVNGSRALVDSTGVGDPIVEQLQRTGRGAFEGYQFTSPSKQKLMEGLAVHIQQRKGTIPDGVLVSELESFEYEYTRTGVRYTAPEGLHDDCVMALALAVEHSRAPNPRVRSLS